jgi:endonuclease YncB( thermonuclease family)
MRADPIATTVAAIAASFVAIDGDTVHRADERYRLAGIDAAEIHYA